MRYERLSAIITLLHRHHHHHYRFWGTISYHYNVMKSSSSPSRQLSSIINHSHIISYSVRWTMMTKEKKTFMSYPINAAMTNIRYDQIWALNNLVLVDLISKIFPLKTMTTTRLKGMFWQRILFKVSSNSFHRSSCQYLKSDLCIWRYDDMRIWW